MHRPTTRCLQNKLFARLLIFKLNKIKKLKLELTCKCLYSQLNFVFCSMCKYSDSKRLYIKGHNKNYEKI